MANKKKNTENIFTQYAEIQNQIKELEEKRKELSNLCLFKMKEERVESMKNDLGVFTIIRRNNYIYSGKVKIAEGEVKALKAIEERDGIAELKISENLMFRSKSKVTKEVDRDLLKHQKEEIKKI